MYLSNAYHKFPLAVTQQSEKLVCVRLVASMHATLKATAKENCYAVQFQLQRKAQF